MVIIHWLLKLLSGRNKCHFSFELGKLVQLRDIRERIDAVYSEQKQKLETSKAQITASICNERKAHCDHT